MHVRDCSCAPILRFLIWHQMAPQQTAKFRTAFLIIFTSLRKDSVANYAWIWTMFSPAVSRFGALYNALNVHSSVGRWPHKIRKFAAEIFQNVKIPPQNCAINTSYSYYLHCN